MTAITAVTDGFRLEAGTYAIVAERWNGRIPDPRTSDSDLTDVLPIPDGDVAVITQGEGLTVLSLPIGADERGSRGRSIAIGPRSVVAFGRLVLVALDTADLQARHYPYASHMDEVVVVDCPKGGTVNPVDGGIDIHGCTVDEMSVFTIDTAAPGAFSMEGEFIDMTLDAHAEAFGYGTPEFNAGLDEHGVFLDLIDIRERLRARTDNEGLALMAKLAGMGPFATAYYAPVAL